MFFDAKIFPIIMQLCCEWEKICSDRSEMHLKRNERMEGISAWKSLITGCGYGKNAPHDKIFVPKLFLCVGCSEERRSKRKMHDFEATQLLNDTPTKHWLKKQKINNKWWN